MAKLHKLVMLTLLFALVTSSIQGQNCCDQDDECGCAYTQGSQTAHWSVYIPIAILVVAAIWFGVSDRNHDHSSYSDSQDALGSIDNSKRNSFRSSGSYRSSIYSRSQGGYSHH